MRLHFAAGGPQADKIRRLLPLQATACGHAVPDREIADDPRLGSCSECLRVYDEWLATQEEEPEDTGDPDSDFDRVTSDDDEPEEGSPLSMLTSLVPDDVVFVDAWREALDAPRDEADPRHRLLDTDRELLDDIVDLAEAAAPELAWALGSALHRALYGQTIDVEFEGTLAAGIIRDDAFGPGRSAPQEDTVPEGTFDDTEAHQPDMVQPEPESIDETPIPSQQDSEPPVEHDDATPEAARAAGQPDSGASAEE